MRLIIFLMGFLTYGISEAQEVFKKTYGAPNCYDEGFGALPVDDGGYLISAAYTCNVSPQNWNSLLLYLDDQGDSVWAKKNVLPNGFIRNTQDNQFIFLGGNQAGLAYDSIVVVKTTQSGDTIWTRSVHFPVCSNVGYDIINTTDEGYALTGIYSSSMDCNNANFESFFVKLDSSGNILWQKIFTGPEDDELFVVRELNDGGFALFGWTESQGAGMADFYLIRTNAQGDSLWSKTYGGAFNDFGYGMDITPDGGFVMVGYSDSINVIKTDPAGNIEWKKTLGPRCGGIYFKTYTTLDKNLAFLVYENTSSGCSSSLIKTDPEGNILWRKNWGGLLREVYQSGLGSYLLTGYISGTSAFSDIYVIKFDTTYEDTTTSVIVEDDLQSTLKIYPNPISDKVTIESALQFSAIRIYDLTGKICLQHIEKSHKSILETSSLPPGMFLLTILLEKGNTVTKKLIVE